MGLRERLFGGGTATAADAARPEALARRRGGPPREGLAWLGRRPDGRTGFLYRTMLGVGSRFLFGAARIRLQVDGRDQLPAGGYLLAVGLHRSWIDPLLVIEALPREPRPWFLGSGPSAFDRPWKEALLRHLGGILPVWRGGIDLSPTVAAGRAVVEAGCPFVLFIEGGVAGPPRSLGHLRHGAGLLALRLGCPIVPLALAGTAELYRGRRLAARILPPLTVADLIVERAADPGTSSARPAEGSRAELELAGLLTERVGERLEAALPGLMLLTVEAPAQPRRWRWLTHLF